MILVLSTLMCHNVYRCLHKHFPQVLLDTLTGMLMATQLSTIVLAAILAAKDDSKQQTTDTQRHHFATMCDLGTT